MRETATLERGDETTCLRTAAAAGAVMELRQYVMRPGRRDELIELFEQRFVDAQEALGIRVLGIFRDLQRPDRFVWMRGFADMAERHRALESFYGGPVWAAHRDAANATMIDSDDVLLLRPARAGAVDAISAAAVLPPANNSADRGIVLAGVHLLRVPAGEEVLRYVEGELPRVLDAQALRLLSLHVTEPAKNHFRLPVREGENALVWVATGADGSAGRAAALRASIAFAAFAAFARALARWEAAPAQLLELVPTPRSPLRHGAATVAPGAAAWARDFDFLHGRWRIHNRRLVERLRGCDTWVEFPAASHCWPMLGGLGNVDAWSTDYWPGFRAMTVRVFDPRARQWAIHWADNRGCALEPPVRGAFDGELGVFTGPDTLRGEPVLTRFHWHRGPAPRWEQACSADGGRSWETNWTMDFTRIADARPPRSESYAPDRKAFPRWW